MAARQDREGNTQEARRGRKKGQVAQVGGPQRRRRRCCVGLLALGRLRPRDRGAASATRCVGDRSRRPRTPRSSTARASASCSRRSAGTSCCAASRRSRCACVAGRRRRQRRPGRLQAEPAGAQARLQAAEPGPGLKNIFGPNALGRGCQDAREGRGRRRDRRARAAAAARRAGRAGRHARRRRSAPSLAALGHADRPARRRSPTC